MALERPTLASAEVSWAQLAGQLVAKHELLVFAQMLKGLDQQAKPQAVVDQLLDVGPHIGRLELARFFGSQRRRLGERRLDAAASKDRPPTIPDARIESLVKRIGYVSVARERPTRSRGEQQLEHGLAVAVLEVLPRQPPAVGAQERLPSGSRDERHCLCRVARASASDRGGVRMTGAERLSGRHVSMSVLAPRLPPLRSAR